MGGGTAEIPVKVLDRSIVGYLFSNTTMMCAQRLQTHRTTPTLHVRQNDGSSCRRWPRSTHPYGTQKVHAHSDSRGRALSQAPRHSPQRRTRGHREFRLIWHPHFTVLVREVNMHSLFWQPPLLAGRFGISSPNRNHAAPAVPSWPVRLFVGSQ